MHFHRHITTKKENLALCKRRYSCKIENKKEERTLNYPIAQNRCATARRKAKLRTGQNKSSPTLLRARELCGAHCALAGVEGFEPSE